MKHLPTFLFCLFVFQIQAQSVTFTRTSLDNAIMKAKREGKNIFIDTYASYCRPCKVQEKEFRNEELASYFNANFVNVRVDMEGPHAAEFKSNYDIVFLPTLLFLSPEGRIRMSIDHHIRGKDLLRMAKHINGDQPVTTVHSPAPPKAKPVTPPPTTQPEEPATKVVTAPADMKPVQAKDIAIKPDEGKVLQVMGQGDALPPELLREEAYFRMRLMDGSHHEAARVYLDTQNDWSSEVNMQFIHDFLYDARSEEFEFLVAHRTAFERLLGEERVAQSIQILVQKELERAFPRPDKKRIKKLKSYL